MGENFTEKSYFTPKIIEASALEHRYELFKKVETNEIKKWMDI